MQEDDGPRQPLWMCGTCMAARGKRSSDADEGNQRERLSHPVIDDDRNCAGDERCGSDHCCGAVCGGNADEAKTAQMTDRAAAHLLELLELAAGGRLEAGDAHQNGVLGRLRDLLSQAPGPVAVRTAPAKPLRVRCCQSPATEPGS